jgi:hypothetical protein
MVSPFVVMGPARSSRPSTLQLPMVTTLSVMAMPSIVRCRASGGLAHRHVGLRAIHSAYRAGCTRTLSPSTQSHWTIVRCAWSQLCWPRCLCSPPAAAPSTGPRRWVPTTSTRAYSFAGGFPTYGQDVSSGNATPAYLRAMRRIDPCGLVTRDGLAEIGEISFVGTLFALDECDIDIKVPAETDRRYASIEVILTRISEPVAFLACDLPVYESSPGVV